MSQEGVRRPCCNHRPYRRLLILSAHRNQLSAPACSSTYYTAGKREHADLQTKVTTSARAASFLMIAPASSAPQSMALYCPSLAAFINVVAAHS